MMKKLVLLVGLAAVGAMLYFGHRVQAAATYYSDLVDYMNGVNWTNSNGLGWAPGNQWSQWQGASWYLSTLPIPDGSSDVEITSQNGACGVTPASPAPQTARHAHRTPPGYTGGYYTQQTAYEVVIATKDCNPGGITWIGAIENLGQGSYYQLMSVQLPAWPSTMTSFIRNDGAYPGLVVRALGLQWYLAAATNLSGQPAIGGVPYTQGQKSADD